MGGLRKVQCQGRQSFFNYYAPRKLVTNTPGDEPDQPPAGDADITLKKVAAGTTRGLDGAKFNVYHEGQIVGSEVTMNGGIIEVKNVTKGLWSFVETEAPAGYCADSTPHQRLCRYHRWRQAVYRCGENYAPDMKIIKRDAMSGKPIAGTVFSIKSVTGNFSTSVTTGTDGSATPRPSPLMSMWCGEESVPEAVHHREQYGADRGTAPPARRAKSLLWTTKKPGLEVIKKNIANGEPIEGVTYRIEQIDGSYSTTATTDSHGRIFLESIPVGTYRGDGDQCPQPCHFSAPFHKKCR